MAVKQFAASTDHIYIWWHHHCNNLISCQLVLRSRSCRDATSYTLAISLLHWIATVWYHSNLFVTGTAATRVWRHHFDVVWTILGRVLLSGLESSRRCTVRHRDSHALDFGTRLPRQRRLPGIALLLHTYNVSAQLSDHSRQQHNVALFSTVKSEFWNLWILNSSSTADMHEWQWSF